MIQIRYKQLFDIEILHSFYANGKSADLQLLPTADCALLLNRLGLKYLPSAYGGKLFAKVNKQGANDVVARPIPAGTKFTFAIRCINNQFLNFSSVKLDRPAGTYYYFNNLVNNLAADNSPLLVSDAASKNVTDADLLPFISNTYSYTHSQNAAQRTGTIQMTDSGESLSQTLNKNNNSFNFTFNLSPLSPGRAKFFVQNAEKQSFYIINAAEEKSLFGIIEIFCSNTLANAYQFLQPNGVVSTKNYKISFGSRQVKWRYIVSKKFNTTLAGIKIAKTTAPAISFAAQGSPPAGQFILASSVALPFKDETIAGIKLTDPADKVIIPNLPNPSAAFLKPEGAELFADILITI